ncbi:MAG: acetate--CoA ligase [Bacteroidota bacterium]
MEYPQQYALSLEQADQFWQEQSKRIAWFQAPQHILSQSEQGFHRWYQGGKLNTSYLALDYQIEVGRGEQTALIYDSPVTGHKRQYTYAELLAEVSLFAGVLQQMGVEKGDRIIIYMPMIPEVVFAMLACARIGAVHSVVFGGFAAHELAIRIDDAQPKLILAASGGKEIDRIVPYKPIIDAALEEASFQPSACIVYQRSFVRAEMQAGRDFDWEKLRSQAEAVGYVSVDAWDPLYILYTSGTTGQPKGIIRDNGGHAVALHASMELVYGMKPGDVFWAASDVGWVVGHSYIVYAPLIYGCTTVLFEGKPIKTPDASTFWRIIQTYRVRALFTAPTAIRAIKKEDPSGQLKASYPTPSLQYLFLAGERTDVATYEWARELLQVPVIDHWWQTESGWPMLSNMAGAGLLPPKPGSVTKAVVGYDVQILDEHGRELPPNSEGSVCIKLPLPPGCLPTLWQDDERFRSSYLDPFPGYYFSADGGYKDEDGYIYITGRIDDIINVAGHRLSTAEMEEVIASHPAVAECAVAGISDELKGQIPVGFVVLKAGETIDMEQLQQQLVQMVRDTIGPVAAFKRALIAKRLPKTRSGKILRKIIRYIADGKSFNPPSTIEDMAVLDELRELMHTHRVGQAFSGVG